MKTGNIIKVPNQFISLSRVISQDSDSGKFSQKINSYFVPFLKISSYCTVTKKRLWCVYGYHSSKVSWRGTGEHVLWAIVLTKATIMLEDVLYMRLSFMRKEGFCSWSRELIFVRAKLDNCWRDILQQWLVYKFA